ncbi:MAG: DNA polymerase III subunit beta [Anaeroplasmataceae bacterium]
MIFTIDRDIFLENLNIISRGIPAKSSMPALTGIKLEVTENDIFMTSSNMDISIQVLINDKSLEIQEPGKTIIPGKFFIDIIRKVNSKKITLSLIENKYLLINVERGEYKLNVMDYNDYPNISFVTEENPLTINSSIIKSIIKETCFATSQSEKKPILTGVNLNYENNILKCIATDSYRLSQKIVNINQNYNSFNVTIPNKSLDELLKVIDNYDDDINLYFSNNKLLFRYNKILFQTRLLEGNYPDTSRLIPQSFPIKIVFNKDELIEAVERVSLLSPRDKEKDKELSYSIIQLTIGKNNSIEIASSNAQIGDAKEEIIVSQIDCESPLTIGFSSKYLIEALRSFESVDISIFMSSDIKPFVVKNDLNDNLTQLILPVRMV